MKYHPCGIKLLTGIRETGLGKVLGGQFDWGGLLPKSNGGVQRHPLCGWPSHVERKGIRMLNCEIDGSSRCESRA